ncbi:PH domain-containing protein [Candidatus Bathyarchaeota archaeon]|nr:PH domain-containing protein [Candidatus Bathyarchaeota archaeon]
MANVPQDVTRILGPGEQVQLYIQQKIYHPKLNVDSVVLTNERIILRHPHDLRLKRDFTDFSYTDVANAVLDKGLLRSTIKCQLRFGGESLNLAELPNSDAEKAYGIIRSNIARYQTPFATGYAAMAPAGPMPQPVSAAAMGVRCPKCGQISVQGSKFCGGCGNKF